MPVAGGEMANWCHAVGLLKDDRQIAAIRFDSAVRFPRWLPGRGGFERAIAVAYVRLPPGRLEVVAAARAA